MRKIKTNNEVMEYMLFHDKYDIETKQFRNFVFINSNMYR